MIAEIDIGNSRIKWRLRREGRPQQMQYLAHDELPQLEQHLEGVSSLRVSSVVDTLGPALHSLAQKLEVPLHFATTTAACAGVVNSYTQPSTMGVDRWLAMLAAFNSPQCRQQYPVCVINSGTSQTIDFISASGQHQGGLILPGRRLLLESLQRNTEKVLFDPKSCEGRLMLGQSTQEAVYNGNQHLLVGAIHQAIATAGELENRQFFLAGGAAEALMADLNVDVHYQPELVLDGLQYIEWPSP